MNEIKYIDVKEFVSEGYLQEVNRQFLHPLGLALEVEIRNGQYFFSGVQDHRDFPEGIVFSPTPDHDWSGKALSISMQKLLYESSRLIRYGWVIQPVEPCITYFMPDEELNDG